MPGPRRTNSPPPDATATATRLVEDHVCTFCGCLCDDLRLTVRGRSILAVEGACQLGRQKFLAYQEPAGPPCTVAGKASSFADAVERAATLLIDSHAPLIAGLAATTCEAQAAAVRLADRIGAAVDWTQSSDNAAPLLALQQMGMSTASWGEIRQRADLIIFWQADPQRTHPRFLERLGLTVSTRFLPGGRSDRTCLVVHSADTRTAEAEAADETIHLASGSDFEALWTLRALCRGLPLDAKRVGSSTGQPLQVWQSLVERMRAARYGVILFDAALTGGRAGHTNCEALFALVCDLNRHTRFVCGSLGEAGNAAGAANVLAWQTGYPMGVDFSHGTPHCHGREFLSQRLIERREVDAVLTLSPVADSQPTLPTIVISNQPEDSRRCDVWFGVATFGISAAGTIHRADELSLPLRPAVTTDLPAAEQVLAAIEQQVMNVASQRT